MKSNPSLQSSKSGSTDGMSVVIHFPETDFWTGVPNWEAAGAISTRRGAMPPGFEDHTVCSDPFRKFSILLDSSTASEICVMTRSDWIGRVLSIELSRFITALFAPCSLWMG